MFKNKILNLIIFTSLVLFFVNSSVAKVASADTTLPDNVKITSSPDGSNTTVVIDSKPGFTTKVETVCSNGKCVNTANSTVLTSEDIKKMEDNFKKQQEVMDKFWKMQDEFFSQQQKIFQDLWGVDSF